MSRRRWCRLEGRPRVLGVIGGSSPFSLGLVEAIANDLPWPDGRLVLQGRNATALESVGRCAARLLDGSGWTVAWTTDLEAALEDVDVVLHQNRYGGLPWRERDEELATALGLPPDETLGPAGLALALRTAAGQRDVAPAIRARGCPVLTMTNPLGISTGALAAEGVDVLGVCEVPELTRRRVAASVGLAPRDLDAAYTGHNHRGFWHHLNHDGNDLLEQAAAAAGPEASAVLALRAVPDKYYPLLSGGGYTRPGRAAELSRIRRGALSQAAQRPSALPSALGARDMPWYGVIVLPVLRALAGSPTEAVVTTVAADGVPVEVRAVLEGPFLRPLPQPPAPARVRDLHARLHRHEAAVLAASAHPSKERVRRALTLDPTVRRGQVAAATDAVLASFADWLTDEGSRVRRQDVRRRP